MVRLRTEDFVAGRSGYNAEVRLPSWSGFQDRSGPYASQAPAVVSDGLARFAVMRGGEGIVPRTQAELEPAQWALDHERELRDAFLEALLPYYLKMRPRYARLLGDSLDEVMPALDSTEAFRGLIGLSTVFVHPPMHEGRPFVGLLLGCSWDTEHSLGCMLHGTSVVDIGGADVAFNFWHPDEAESEPKGN